MGFRSKKKNKSYISPSEAVKLLEETNVAPSVSVSSIIKSAPVNSDKSHDLLGVKDAADYLGMSEKWIRARIDKREIRYFLLGKIIKLKRDDLDRYLKDNEVKAAS